MQLKANALALLQENAYSCKKNNRKMKKKESKLLCLYLYNQRILSINCLTYALKEIRYNPQTCVFLLVLSGVMHTRIPQALVYSELECGMQNNF